MIEDITGAVRRPEHRSSRALFGESVAHAKGYVAAEKEAITLRVKLTASVAKTVAVFGVVAVVLALFGLGWLLVAGVGALAHLVGYAWAALIVALVLLLAAYLCVRKAARALSILSGSAE